MLKPADTAQSKRLMMAIAFSLVIMLGFELLGFGNHAARQAQQQAAATVSPTTVVATEVAPAQTPVAAEEPITPLVLENENIKLTYNLKGGKLAGWELKNYTKNGGNDLGYQHLHTEGPTAEYAESGWLGAGIQTPDATAVWQIIEATPTRAVLGWKNDSGQIFSRTLTLEDTYTLRMSDNVANTAALPVSLSPYAQTHRAGGELGSEMSTWVSYHGPMGLSGNEEEWLLHEEDFTSVKDAKNPISINADGGWWGISSHYFLSAWVPTGWGASTRAFRTGEASGKPIFTASLQGSAQVVPSGGQTQVETLFYGGPKQEEALLNAGHGLERAIDWGWFRAIARPMYQMLLWFHTHTGSWALAIVLITLALKLATFPLANKSYHAMAKMKKLQPQMEAMKERFKDDQQGMALEMMKLYRDNKVNPLSGCWPMLIQIPIFFAMYKVVLLAFEFRHAAPGLWPLDYWVLDLSLADPFFILPLLMGISMWAQMQLNPPPADPAQAMVFKWMPAIFTVMFLWFPAALVWYWLVNNIFSVAQQYWIMRGDKAV